MMPGYYSPNAGEVISAANWRSYVRDQTVNTFPNASARDSAITAPTEGMVCFLQDVDRLEFYIAGRWRPLPPAAVDNSAALTTMFTATPADGDTAYRTDLHAPTYWHSGLGLWVFSGAVPIARTVLGADTAQVTFSSIPQDFRQLLVIANGRCAENNISGDVGIRFNGASDTLHNSHTVYADGGGVKQASLFAQSGCWYGGFNFAGATAPTNWVGGGYLLILNYSRSGDSQAKICVGQSSVIGTSAGNAVSGSRFGMWLNSNAINQITFLLASGAVIKAGSMFELYGLS